MLYEFLLKIVQQNNSYNLKIKSLNRVTSNIVYKLCQCNTLYPVPSPTSTELNEFRLYIDLSESLYHASSTVITETRDSLQKVIDFLSEALGVNPVVLIHQFFHLIPLYNSKNGGGKYGGGCTEGSGS